MLYLSADADCAVGEVFADRPQWTEVMFRHPASNSLRALHSYELAPTTRLCDLDDPSRLIELGSRPSRVVTKNRSTTQALADRIYDSGRYGGIQWWSSLDADMTALALWDRSTLRHLSTEPLTLDHPAVMTAAARLAKPLR
jgi:RES domain